MKVKISTEISMYVCLESSLLRKLRIWDFLLSDFHFLINCKNCMPFIFSYHGYLNFPSILECYLIDNALLHDIIV